MNRFTWPAATSALLALGLFSAGCTDDKTSPTTSEAGGGGGHWLDKDPGTSDGVHDSRDKAPMDDAIVTGRVSDLVQGFQAFKITDEALVYCGQGGAEDGCPTPWDYCCLAADEVRSNTILVELQDSAGAPLAGSVSGLRPLDLLSVRGKLKKDDHGNVTLVADGFFRKNRPAVGDHVDWP